MKPVYLIVLMGQSPANFLKAAPSFIHREMHCYDSGAHTVNLTKTIYISLDTFKKFGHNKSIDTELYMIDEMKKEIDELKKERAAEISALASAIAAFHGMGKSDEEICQLMNVEKLPR